MMHFILAFVLIPFYLNFPLQATSGSSTIYKTVTGKVNLKSEAPLETIEAESNELRGIIDTSTNTFAFSVSLLSFKGFNGPLQKEHFNENYLESELYPLATFTGKIIEDIDFTKSDSYEVRAKGVLNVHGVKQERIIKGKLEIANNKMVLKSVFFISLSEHDIRIPKIVYQKIAPDIEITINAILNPTSR